jgi:hypothetical protein
VADELASRVLVLNLVAHLIVNGEIQLTAGGQLIQRGQQYAVGRSPETPNRTNPSVVEARALVPEKVVRRRPGSG